MSRGFWKLDDVSDERLVQRLKGLLAAEGRTVARVVAHLAELDERRLHLIGGRSLFEYCQKELGLSDGQAFYRITAARTARRFPIVFELLDRRQIHITTITLISKYLTEENHLEILREVRGLTKRQVLELLVRRFPKAGVENDIRRLPPRPGTVTAGPTGLLEPLNAERYCLQLDIDRETLETLELARDLMSHSNPTGDLAVVVKRAVKGLVERLMKERFGGTDRARRKARRATVAQGPMIDEADARRGLARGDVVESGLSQQEGDHGAAAERDPEREQATPGARSSSDQRTRMGKEGDALRDSRSANAQSDHFVQPRSGGPSNPPSRNQKDAARGEQPGSKRRRRVGSAVRRELIERDGLCCTYVSKTGMRCTARAFLQVDHEQAWSKGGADDASNLRILCRAHNLLLAEREFGRRAITKAG